MVKTSQHIVGEECIRNDEGVLAVSDEDNKIAWKILTRKNMFRKRKFMGNEINRSDSEVS